MSDLAGTTGSFFVTADTQVAPTTARVRLFNLHVISTGGGGAVVSANSGGSGGTAYITVTGTTSTGSTANFESGIILPAGLYINVDGNTASVAGTYRVEAS